MNREHELAVSVVGALLREGYAGLSARIRPTPGGAVLELPRGQVLPLEPDGFLADFRIAPAAARLTLRDVDVLLAEISDARDRGGVAAFGEECRQALAALRLRDQHLPCYGPGPWLGLAGMVRYDALAAATPHPAYPTWACRLGFSDDDLLKYAPEYAPDFELNWVAIPRTVLVRADAAQPSWWPVPAVVGLPAAVADSCVLLPVHPVTARCVLGSALAQAGVPDAVLAPGTALRVRPTLSVRTVAVTADPGTHLKLPLPVSTLGLRNRRGIAPATLADGARVRRVLAELIRADPGLGPLLLADDTRYVHAGHLFLGYLLRRLPGGLDGCHVVPVAALLAPASGRTVIETLAGGCVLTFVAAYFEVLFQIAVRLFVRYGIVLESHQQNAALVLDPVTRELRLLVKDFDGALIKHDRLAPELAPELAPVLEFADRRLLTNCDDELADVFITITVHLCAGAIAFGLAERGCAPLSELLALIRRALTGALDRYPGDPAAALLRTRVLTADRLPGKAMLTAGTLVDKSRTGARDINKFIGTTGPNYLRERAR